MGLAWGVPSQQQIGIEVKATSHTNLLEKVDSKADFLLAEGFYLQHQQVPPNVSSSILS